MKTRRAHRASGQIKALYLSLAIGVSAYIGCATSDSLDGAEGTRDALSAAANQCISRAAAANRSDAAVCASCECGSCTTETNACYGSGDASKDALCASVVACERQNACTGDACYCGASGIFCGLIPGGPCVSVINAAMGASGLAALDKARQAADPASPLVRAEALVACGAQQCAVACAPATAPGSTTKCSLDDLACQERICQPNPALEQQRQDSAATISHPVIQSIAVGGAIVWTAGSSARPSLQAGQTVTLTGTGFGRGTDIDFSKILIGNSRVLETDLKMYEQQLNLTSQVNYETAQIRSTWDKDVLTWTDTQIVFRVPVHASKGPLVVQVQKRLPGNDSLLRPGEKHLVVNAQTSRITDAAFVQSCDVVSGLGPASTSAAIDVDIVNAGFADLVKLGRQIFWSYDYNLGLAHNIRGEDWPSILAGKTTDPMTGSPADPLALFGAYAAVRGQVPDEAIDDVAFNPYPQKNPIPGFLLVTPQLTSGTTKGTGWVGYRYAQASNPFSGWGQWIGFNCASCHGDKITYEDSPGHSITRIVPGLPNPRWSMKWSVLSNMKGVKGDELGPRWAPGTATVDKTALIYAIPQGAGEHTIVRAAGEGSHTDNDYQFSPIAIPNVTHYMGIRRSLSHTESYVGFEGSYIHSEEPDGSLGSMDAKSLQALTTYMTTLDQGDDALRRAGLYRWLKDEGRLASDVGAGVTEGEAVQRGFDAYPALAAKIAAGKAAFTQRCGSCHGDGIGENTTEQMVRLDDVGRFFAPTVYQRQTQSIRATFLRDVYFTQQRGLLSDGHVRNARDLVDPARCTQGSALYNQYYTLHAPHDPGPGGSDFPTPYPASSRRGDVFRVPLAASSAANDAGDQRNKFIERHRYFVKVPWDANYYYWDYQKMRAEYGPAEMGTAGPIGMPAAPHPWCASTNAEADSLLYFLLSL